MVDNFKDWCMAVAKETSKLGDVEDYLNADGCQRLEAFRTLDSLKEFATDAADMLNRITNTHDSLSGSEIEALKSRHISTALKRLEWIAAEGTRVSYPKTVRFKPEIGKTYRNHGGGTFRCLWSSDTGATFINTKSGWKFSATEVIQYSDGSIEWAWSSGGHFVELEEEE